MCETREHRRHRHRRFERRMPSRDELLRALEERQKDLEEEIADIHDLLRRLRDETATSEPVSSV
jgi:hypothetical protein